MSKKEKPKVICSICSAEKMPVLPLCKNGHELLDPTPMEVPVGYKRPPTLQEQVQRLVAGELSRVASSRGRESFEEADDFAVGDDVDPVSPHELVDEQQDRRWKDWVEEQPDDIRTRKKKLPAASAPATPDPKESELPLGPGTEKSRGPQPAGLK